MCTRREAKMGAMVLMIISEKEDEGEERGRGKCGLLPSALTLNERRSLLGCFLTRGPPAGLLHQHASAFRTNELGMH